MRGCIKGNPKARKTLYEMYAPQMLSVCHRYADNSEDAKDIFQQAFYQVYKNLNQLKDHNALSGWIKRIFVNTALQYYKKQRPYLIVDSSDIHYELKDTFDPLSSMSEKEILKLIQELPRGCREVFNMYAIEGFSHKEIAEKLGISVGTSKSQLHDARKMLKTAIIKNSDYKKTTNFK